MGYNFYESHMGFPGVPVLKKSTPANAGDTGDAGLIPWVGKILWRRKWQPTPVFWPGKSRGRRSLVAIVHGGHQESDVT